MAPTYNYFKGIPELPDYARQKTKKPKLIAVVDEDNCKCGLKGKYFNVHGRVKEAEIRGCSDAYL